jgi:hypothetical protein
VIDAFALALFDALVNIAHRMAPRVGDAAEHLREVARPPRGVELHADDDALYTGLIVVEKNRPVLMLAVRVGERRADVERRPPLVTPPPEPRPPYFNGGQRSLHLDPDDPRWAYENPYGRRLRP